MTAIGPGDFVECIDDSPDSWGDPVPITLGAVYVVEAVVSAPDAAGDIGEAFVIQGVSVPFWDHGQCMMAAFDASRFRPIYRPNPEAFRHLLQPTDFNEPVSVPA